MKKFLKYLAVSLILVPCMLILSACSFIENGLSAYDIAVKNGFVGSEVEWLASLKGADGKDYVPGEEFASAYDIAVKNGFVGTEAEWLASLVSQMEINLNGVSAAAQKAMRSVVAVEATFDSAVSSGAGVIYQLNKETGDAIVITNHHVINYNGNRSADIGIYLYGMYYTDYRIAATAVGDSATYDIAVLEVTGSERLKNSIALAVEIEDSDKISFGDTVIAVGNPGGFSVTAGIVSVEEESVSVSSQDFIVIRVDAAINSGNSGGGLFDINGKLVGIVNAKTATSDVDTIGFAIPSNVAINAAINIINNGTVKRVVLGIQTSRIEVETYIDDVSGKIRTRETISVYSINEDSVTKNKLEVNDILLSFTHGGITYNIDSLYKISTYFLKLQIGESIDMNINRNGTNMTFTFVVTNTITES